MTDFWHRQNDHLLASFEARQYVATSFVLSRPVKKRVNTKLLGEIDLPETNSEFTVLKIDGWKTSFILGRLGLFSGVFAVSFREINFPQFFAKGRFYEKDSSGKRSNSDCFGVADF